MVVVVVTALPFLVAVKVNAPVVLAAGNNVTTSETTPLPACGVKVAEIVQAAPIP